RLFTTSTISFSRSRRYASTRWFAGYRNFIEPEPNTLVDLRTWMMCCIHESREWSVRFCDRTLTAGYPQTGFSISGEYKLSGSAEENPPFQPPLHCMGVRTPLRSPR